MVIFFHDLLIQSIADTTAKDIGVMSGLNLAASDRFERRCILAKKFDMFLGQATSLFY